MDPFKNEILEQPDEGLHLWRYIKPQWIDSFLEGNIFFSPLTFFDDYLESITPLHYHILKFLKTSLALNFDLSKPIQELEDPEQILETLLMSVGIYDIEKKVSRLTGITDKKKLGEFIMHQVNNLNSFVKPHLEFQKKHYASCWFVSDHIESALMWSAYSQKGGIAVRLSFGEFKKAFKKYFDGLTNINIGAKSVYGGLVKYVDYNDGETWLKEINRGNPLPFFKQHFYKQESEYRVVVEGDEASGVIRFDPLNKIFTEDVRFKITLHPTAGPNDLKDIKSKIKGSKFLKVSLSGMDFNLR